MTPDVGPREAAGDGTRLGEQFDAEEASADEDAIVAALRERLEG